jgi:Glycosyl transferase family 11
MIVSELCGGLGNQMFCYASGRAVAERLHTNLVLNPYTINLPLWQKYRPKNKGATVRDEGALKNFNIDAKYIGKLDSYLSYLIPVYRERCFQYDNNIDCILDNTRLSGYFQSEKYFKDIEDIIRKEFTLKDPLYHTIHYCDISIHIRRGDYVNNTESFKVHGVLPLEYYYKAIDIIAKKIGTPVFYIFSDDAQWVRDNLEIPYDHCFLNHGKDCHDMMLMSYCQHHIIANSSFSWWGAWLCQNKDKIVIAPKQWFADKSMNDNTRDLIPKGWMRI